MKKMLGFPLGKVKACYVPGQREKVLIGKKWVKSKGYPVGSAIP